MVLFVTDDTSRKIADVMWDAAREFPNRSLVMMSDRSMHGEEPPLSVSGAMTKADWFWKQYFIWRNYLELVMIRCEQDCIELENNYKSGG